jgi:hypothetical protein
MRAIETFTGERCKHAEIQPMHYTLQVYLTNCHTCLTIPATHVCAECGRAFCHECADAIYEECLYE